MLGRLLGKGKRLLHRPGRSLIMCTLLCLVSPLLSRGIFLLWKEVELFPELPLVRLTLGQSHRLGQGSSGVRLPPIRVLHQSWRSSSLPARFQNWSESWRACYPDWQYRLWTDSDNEAFVRTKFPDFYPVWLSLPTSIERVDSVRYLYMYSLGGLYTDLDSECMRPFVHLLGNCSVVLGSMSAGSGLSAYRMPSGLVQNSFMYSQPGHRLWSDLIQEISRINGMQSVNRLTGANPLAEDRTGPLLLMRVLKAHWSDYNGSVCIYSPDFFNPFSWYREDGACKTLNLMSDRQLALCRAAFNGSYAIQYHTQVWRKGKANMLGA